MGKSIFERMAEVEDDDIEDDRDPDVDPEVAVITYAEIAKRYGDNPFVVGDIVTPRRGYHLLKAGTPCVVVESLKEPLRAGHPDPAHKDYHPRLDVRVIRQTRDNITTMWYESWQLEYWKR